MLNKLKHLWYHPTANKNKTNSWIKMYLNNIISISEYKYHMYNPWLGINCIDTTAYTKILNEYKELNELHGLTSTS